MVEQPTVIFGKNQSGKTWRAFHLWNAHQGPAIFADIQWRSYVPATHTVYSIEDVVGVLNDVSRRDGGTWDAPKINWRIDNYAELGPLVDYLLAVHKQRHIEGLGLPCVALFMDEVWRVAGRGADATNPAVRVFTEGNQHRVMGVAISQWISQVAHLIPGNAYEFYVFDLWERDLELLRQIYRMEPPDPRWLGDYRYWRYDGGWWKGDANGVELRYDQAPGVPELQEGGEAPPDEEVIRPHQEGKGSVVEEDRMDMSGLRTYD